MLKTRLGRLGGALALTLSASLIAVGCSSDSDDSASSTTTSSVVIPKGGTLVIGAEQEPDCVDWIASCAGSSWGSWMLKVQTIPAAFVVRDVDGTWTPQRTDVLAEDPKVEQVDGKQVITYKLGTKAVWSDGTAITAKDFVFTAESVRDGEDIYDKSGYDKIESIEATDDTTVKLTLDSSYPDWRGFFSGGYGLLPAHLLEGKDRSALMKDGYDFSGGPWKLEKWEKGVSITLIPNDKYWGDKPNLDKVIFQFTTDTAAAFQGFKAGQVSAIYPQPQLDAIDQINAGLENAQSQYSAESGNVEALWMNNAKFPFDSLAVRQAFGYSLDRDAIVKRLFGGVNVNEAVQSFLPPISSAFATEDFEMYTLNLDKVDELMTGDGWAKGSDGIWAKDGKRATIEMATTAGNKRRELTQQILQTQAKEAGFEITIANAAAGELFGQKLPEGDYTLALYAQVATFPIPGNSALFNSKNIPTAENGFSGQNWTRTNVEGLDELLEQVDTELDEAKRIELSKKAEKLLADSATSLPLDPLPNILIWSNDVLGPVSDNPVEGPFWNLAAWGKSQA